MALERHAGRLWVASSGGPLLVLETQHLVSWGGLDNGDYDRACAATRVVEAIDVGEARGLILGDEPAMTAVVPRADGVAFVRWHSADDAEAVERAIVALQRAPALDTADAGLTWPWGGPEIVVFDSVEPGHEQVVFDLPAGREIGDGALRAPLRAGTYAVRLGALDPEVGALAVLQLLAVAVAGE